MEEYHSHLGIATVCACSYVINIWASLQDKKENNKTALELTLETKLTFFRLRSYIIARLGQSECQFR